MAAKLGKISAGVLWNIEKAITGFKSAVHPGALNAEITFDPANLKVVGKTYSLNASASTVIDLKTDTDPLSVTVNMTKAMAIMITASGNTVKATFHGTDGLSTWVVQNSGELVIKSGGFALIGWPYAVAATVASNSKLVTLTNSSGTAATGKIVIFGA